MVIICPLLAYFSELFFWAWPSPRAVVGYFRATAAVRVRDSRDANGGTKRPCAMRDARCLADGMGCIGCIQGAWGIFVLVHAVKGEGGFESCVVCCVLSISL